MADLSGINLAMQTPFNEDGSINYVRWEELIDIYIDAGVHGLVLGSGTGQHPYLTEAETEKLYELGCKRIDGRVSIICQPSALNMDEVIRRSCKAQDLGADALMILPPYFEGPTDDDGMFDFYKTIDAEINIDIVGYNIPQATGITVSPELYVRLSQLPNFNYIKDSSGDLATLQAYMQTGNKVLNGADPNSVFAFMAGASGAVWGCANYMPHECVKLYDLVKSGNHVGALELWKKMIPSLLHIWHGNYFSSVKSACRMRGFEGGTVRRPLKALSIEAESELAKTLELLDS